MKRREFLYSVAGAAALPSAALRGAGAETNPIAVTAGDVVPGRAVLWARAAGPTRLHAAWRTAAGNAWQRRVGPYCLDGTDFTGRLELTDLPAGQRVEYQIQFEDLSAPGKLSEPLAGSFRTPGAGRDVKFLWSGDNVGQGWGINPDLGGMRIYEAMRRTEPDFFIHSGDTIYADQPLTEKVGAWRNIVTEEKSKVAETQNEFFGNHRYNLIDGNFRRFLAEVPQVWQWDDHEVMNNWSPSKDIHDNPLYKEKSVPLLVARAQRAFQSYAPLRITPEETERVYRKIAYGPLLDVFVLDMRTYRGPNNYNLQAEAGADTEYMGKPQLDWLKQGLRDSKAVWKVIAADMPLGLVVPDGKDKQGRPIFENSANGDGPALGRELEIADVLRFIKAQKVRNTVWLTADVHYTAAHYYDPAKAQFTDFDPFWEFVSGPLSAGAFGPNQTDNTFGIQVVYQKCPPKEQQNANALSKYQFFGEVAIGNATRSLTVTLRDLDGTALFAKELAAQG
jgi:alkaline phosphatase D